MYDDAKAGYRQSSSLQNKELGFREASAITREVAGQQRTAAKATGPRLAKVVSRSEAGYLCQFPDGSTFIAGNVARSKWANGMPITVIQTAGRYQIIGVGSAING